MWLGSRSALFGTVTRGRGNRINKMAWRACKERGNTLYQAKNFKEAVEAYTEALEKCSDDKDQAILYKNRAASFIKLKEYETALYDCDAALQISPRDVKSLYRRSQALEGVGNLSEAFKTIKLLLSVDPSNNEASLAARRMVESMRRQADVQQSTSEKVKDMFATLENGTDNDLKIRAAKNFAILSRDSSGREELVGGRSLARLVTLIESDVDQVVHHIFQTFIGLCGGGLQLTLDILKTISLEKLTQKVTSARRAVGEGAIGLMKTVIVTLSTSTEKQLLVATIETLLSVLLRSDVPAGSRDAALDAITTTLDQVRLALLAH